MLSVLRNDAAATNPHMEVSGTDCTTQPNADSKDSGDAHRAATTPTLPCVPTQTSHALRKKPHIGLKPIGALC